MTIPLRSITIRFTNLSAVSLGDARTSAKLPPRQVIDRPPRFASSSRRRGPQAILMVGGLLLLAVGCAEPIPGPAPSADGTLTDTETVTPSGMEGISSMPTSPPTTPASPDARETTAGAPRDEAAPQASPALAPSQAGQPARTDVERVTADVGVGQRGRSLDKYEGAVERTIVEPARTLFAVRERMVFSTQIPQAMQLYKATHGRGPASQEEFLREIVQANNIRLPELPAGQRYVYDPASEELLVERPAR